MKHGKTGTIEGKEKQIDTEFKKRVKKLIHNRLKRKKKSIWVGSLIFFPSSSVFPCFACLILLIIEFQMGGRETYIDTLIDLFFLSFSFSVVACFFFLSSFLLLLLLLNYTYDI